MNIRHNKKIKGQIEIFGLAVIVILISIGFFIFVSLKAQHPTENPQKEYTNDKLANDFVLSILDVNVKDCDTFTLKDLIVDCGRDRKIDCGGTSSCFAANKTITDLLNGTFMVMNTKFRFYSENLKDNAGREIINITHLNCTSNMRQGQRGTAIISLYPWPNNVYLNMNICYQ
jgi:hypothetical protein